MNDFTKEELEIILKIWEHAGPVGACIEGMGAVINKIKFMIDNFCHHKIDILPLYTTSGDIPIAGFCYECNKPVDKDEINE